MPRNNDVAIKRRRGRPQRLERKTVQTAVWLFEDQREKLKRIAREKGITPSALMRDLIDKLTEESKAGE